MVLVRPDGCLQCRLTSPSGDLSVVDANAGLNGLIGVGFSMILRRVSERVRGPGRLKVTRMGRWGNGWGNRAWYRSLYGIFRPNQIISAKFLQIYRTLAERMHVFPCPSHLHDLRRPPASQFTATPSFCGNCSLVTAVSPSGLNAQNHPRSGRSPMWRMTILASRGGDELGSPHAAQPRYKVRLRLAIHRVGNLSVPEVLHYRPADLVRHVSWRTRGGPVDEQDPSNTAHLCAGTAVASLR